MEEWVYLSVRVYCITFVIYKVWQWKGRINHVCDLLFVVNEGGKAQQAFVPAVNEVDVMGKTRFVYLDENAGKTMAPYMSEPLEMESDYIGEEADISADDVECNLPLDAMELLAEEQELWDQDVSDVEVIWEAVSPDELSLVGDVLMQLNGAGEDEEKVRSAARTLFAIRNTNLFDLFTSQVGNADVVNQLLEQHLDEDGNPLIVKEKKSKPTLNWRDFL